MFFFFFFFSFFIQKCMSKVYVCIDVDALAATEIKLHESPYLYEKRLIFIAALKTNGDALRIRAAREGMSKAFPLTEAYAQPYIFLNCAL